jgi:hypothetical protein
MPATVSPLAAPSPGLLASVSGIDTLEAGVPSPAQGSRRHQTAGGSIFDDIDEE